MLPGSLDAGLDHDIRVKVNRQDVVLQARRGYYSATSAPRPIVQPKGRHDPPELLEAMWQRLSPTRQSAA